MEALGHSVRLAGLADWSRQHIRDIFEAPTEEQALKAISSTFSADINASINGSPIKKEDIKNLVLAMRRSSAGGLKVQWQQAVEVPKDPLTNREGSFGGVYVIRGITKMVPGHDKPVEFERHKTVTVKIESLSSDPSYDSRRIVNLVFVASDVRVHRQATL
ncbi:hypothetical protein BDQ12DRAFT_653972 [Crucibulum laeve]|uniref:Uncharacterized protein n=1 Tax=Crucibulum laeve TaxID=68775 RepID=A0A5C3LUL2_9AGAR|nr:hypothetical protein BDQ12DRAFT_653972 [Crucibulum laeve]